LWVGKPVSNLRLRKNRWVFDPKKLGWYSADRQAYRRRVEFVSFSRGFTMFWTKVFSATLLFCRDVRYGRGTTSLNRPVPTQPVPPLNKIVQLNNWFCLDFE
jgi:hypothetical protein